MDSKYSSKAYAEGGFPEKEAFFIKTESVNVRFAGNNPAA